jgi:hypothetical protein
MQEQFREAYPGLDEQFERLRTQLRAPVGVGTGVR